MNKVMSSDSSNDDCQFGFNVDCFKNSDDNCYFDSQYKNQKLAILKHSPQIQIRMNAKINQIGFRCAFVVPKLILNCPQFQDLIRL